MRAGSSRPLALLRHVGPTALGRRLRPAGQGERGAIGVLVGVLVAGGVLLGMGAMTIDVGELYVNRADLQNGADAAALAIAGTCANGPCDSSVGTQYIDQNASKLTGGTNAETLVCGNDYGMNACPTPSGKLYDCPAAPSGSAYVDVYTQTKTASGSSLLPPTLATTLLGDSGYKGTTVKACAQAFYGPPSGANVTSLTISANTWDSATSGGTDFAPAPPNYNPDSYYDTVLPLGSSSGAEWIGDSGNCSTYVGTATYSGSTSPTANSDCVSVLYDSWEYSDIIYVPGYTSMSTSGSSATFHLRGFAAFVVTGYNLPGGYYESDWLNSDNNGGNGSRYYVNGYFTTGVISSLDFTNDAYCVSPCTIQGTPDSVITSTGQFQYPHDINGGDDMGGELVQLSGAGAEVTPYYGIDNP